MGVASPSRIHKLLNEHRDERGRREEEETIEWSSGTRPCGHRRTADTVGKKQVARRTATRARPWYRTVVHAGGRSVALATRERRRSCGCRARLEYRATKLGRTHTRQAYKHREVTRMVSSRCNSILLLCNTTWICGYSSILRLLQKYGRIFNF